MSQSQFGRFRAVSANRGASGAWRTKFSHRIFSRLGGVALAILIFSGSNCFAQSFVNGAIAGSVFDSTGAGVQETMLTLTNLDTASTLKTQSNTSGQYQFLNLPPSRYRLDVRKNGFRPFTRDSIVIQVNSTLKLDVTLSIGTVPESVTVTGETPQLQPETSDLGQVIDERAANELPLNGRNPMALVALAPGVVPQGQFGQAMVGLNAFASGNVQINGGEANQNAAYWDGAPLNAIGYINLQALIPTQDALQEFKVMTDNMPAEYDRFAGGIVNFTTKTGTNEYHGESYEFLRNKVLNANNYFNDAAGIPVPAFTQNQFGANFGGPFIIPGLYNGKGKTFFFVSYDGFRLRQGLPLQFSVPTAAERSGDFSNLRDSNGNAIPIYDPSTTIYNSNTGTYSRTQISCNGVLNVICPQNIDPAAKVLENLWGPPNQTGVFNWVGNASQGGDSNQFTARADQNVSDKQRFFSRYTINKLNNLAVDPFHTNVGTPENFAVQQAVAADSYSFSPGIIADLELSYLREGYGRVPESLGYDLSQLGPGWAPLNTEVTFRTLPTLCVSGYTDFCSPPFGTSSVITDHTDDYTFQPNLTMIHGRHDLKFGAVVWVSRFNFAQDNIPSGQFNFGPTSTASSPFGGAGGDGFASLLLGDAQGGTLISVNRVAAQIIYRAFYVQDNIRITRNLTLNLGLRNDEEGAFSERFNRISTFLPDATSPLASPTGLPLKGTFALVDTPQRHGRSAYDMPVTRLAPRVGFGYQLTTNTVLRGGYGIFWLPSAVTTGGENPFLDPVNSYTNPFLYSIDGGITPYNHLGNPFPNGVLPAPGRSSSFQSILYGASSQTAIPTNPFPGYAEQWNLDIQRELPGKLFVDIAYAGSRGVHLPSPGQINQLNPAYLSLGNNLFDSVANPFYNLVPPTSGLYSPTIPAEQLLLPFPQYSWLAITQNYFDSRYHSMQLKASRKSGNGQQILVSYTVSKLITNADSLTSWLEPAGNTAYGLQNYDNLKGEESLATFDVPQRLVASYILELPLGRGKRYLAGASGMVGGIASGWGIDGIATLQRGFPLFLSSTNFNGAFNAGSRPSYDYSACPNGNPNLHSAAEGRLNEWFNTNCFVTPPPFTFGDVPRTLPTTRTDGLKNMDVSVFKNTSLGPEDRLAIEFRCEVFNLFNTPQFGYPGMVQGTQQFGIVSSQANQPRLIQFAMKLKF